MIDIHHHCLPGVDDGPRELSEAVDLCRMAGDEGIDTIIATPHVLRGRWPQFSRAELQQRFDTLRAAVGDSPRLLLGSEYFFGHDIAELLANGESIIPLADSRYVLVEFASNAVPPLVEQPFYRIQLAGWVPVIAHPERNTIFQNRPELLAGLIRHGARTQITAGSLTGEFGGTARRAAEEWLRRGMVHFVATDAHNSGRRAPRTADALSALRDIAGEAVSDALTRTNPLCVIENRPLEYEPEIMEPPTGGFLSGVRKLLGLT